jgi:hypothetical protein
LIDAQYARAVELVREHHEEIVALYLELWHRKVRDTHPAYVAVHC